MLDYTLLTDYYTRAWRNKDGEEKLNWFEDSSLFSVRPSYPLETSLEQYIGSYNVNTSPTIEHPGGFHHDNILYYYNFYRDDADKDYFKEIFELNNSNIYSSFDINEEDDFKKHFLKFEKENPSINNSSAILLKPYKESCRNICIEISLSDIDSLNNRFTKDSSDGNFFILYVDYKDEDNHNRIEFEFWRSISTTSHKAYDDEFILRDYINYWLTFNINIRMIDRYSGTDDILFEENSYYSTKLLKTVMSTEIQPVFNLKNKVSPYSEVSDDEYNPCIVVVAYMQYTGGNKVLFGFDLYDDNKENKNIEDKYIKIFERNLLKGSSYYQYKEAHFSFAKKTRTHGGKYVGFGLKGNGRYAIDDLCIYKNYYMENESNDFVQQEYFSQYDFMSYLVNYKNYELPFNINYQNFYRRNFNASSFECNESEDAKSIASVLGPTNLWPMHGSTMGHLSHAVKHKRVLLKQTSPLLPGHDCDQIKLNFNNVTMDSEWGWNMNYPLTDYYVEPSKHITTRWKHGIAIKMKPGPMARQASNFNLFNTETFTLDKVDFGDMEVESIHDFLFRRPSPPIRTVHNPYWECDVSHICNDARWHTIFTYESWKNDELIDSFDFDPGWLEYRLNKMIISFSLLGVINLSIGISVIKDNVITDIPTFQIENYLYPNQSENEFLMIQPGAKYYHHDEPTYFNLTVGDYPTNMIAVSFMRNGNTQFNYPQQLDLNYFEHEIFDTSPLFDAYGPYSSGVLFQVPGRNTETFTIPNRRMKLSEWWQYQNDSYLNSYLGGLFSPSIILELCNFVNSQITIEHVYGESNINWDTIFESMDNIPNNEQTNPINSSEEIYSKAIV